MESIKKETMNNFKNLKRDNEISKNVACKIMSEVSRLMSYNESEECVEFKDPEEVLKFVHNCVAEVISTEHMLRLATEREIENLKLQIRTIQNGNEINDPLVRDIERWRTENNENLKCMMDSYNRINYLESVITDLKIELENNQIKLKESNNLLREIYDWTVYKHTTWSIKVKKILSIE